MDLYIGLLVDVKVRKVLNRRLDIDGLSLYSYLFAQCAIIVNDYNILYCRLTNKIIIIEINN
jgi:hypothetical protein